MAELLEVEVCVVGAGPVGAALACALAAGGVRVAVIDRAALPPMEHPAFDAPGLRHCVRLAPPVGRGRRLGPAAVRAVPHPGHPRLRRADRAPRIAALLAFRPCGRRGRAVRLDGGGPQPPRRAEWSIARGLPRPGVRPCRGGGQVAGGGGGGAGCGRPDDPVPPGRGRRGTRVAVAGAGGDQGLPPRLSPERHRDRRRA